LILKTEKENLMDNEYFMKKALSEAQAALDAGEFPVGCVMVHQNKILVSGARKGTTGDNPNEIDHAELIALRRLNRLDSKISLREVTVFSTLEPCLMCFGALMISGIGNLVFAYEDAMGGGTGCEIGRLAPLYQSNQMAVTPGILRAESLKLLKAFFSEPENAYLRDTLLATYTLDQQMTSSE
jgi:tRNA(adenine34) deaminase